MPVRSPGLTRLHSLASVATPAVPGRTLPAWDRTATGCVMLLALLLVAISLGGFFYLRRELAEIAAEHLRLRVSGPAKLQPGVANQFRVFTSSVTGGRLPAQVQFSLHACDSQKLLLGYNERTDPEGRLLVTLPADAPLATAADLQVVAVQGNRVERVAARLAVAPVRYLVQSSTDRRRYRPGDTVYYRVTVLSCIGSEADRALKVRFEIQGPGGSPLPGSPSEGVSQQGVVAGAYLLPAALPAGAYTLVVRSEEGWFAEQRHSFSVGSAPIRTPDADSGSSPTRPKAASLAANDRAGPDVSFYPEGGDLVAGLVNRVYFLARDPLDQPVQIRGKVVDAQGEPKTAVETAFQGMGQFSFQPQAGETYRLELESPAKRSVKLPDVVPGRKVTLSTGRGLFEPGKPLEFNVRATNDGLPLLAAAYCRGLLVGQQAFASQAGANEVSVSPDASADGVIRLAIYDYSTSPPEPVAQRLVYRRPSRRLQVRLADRRDRYAPGGHVSLSLLVTDENDKPAPAVLGVSVVNATVLDPSGSRPPAPSDRLLAADVDRPEEMEQLDEYLSQQPKSTAALDLFLGTRGAGVAQSTPSVDPPSMFDNLAELEKRYRKSLDAYQAKRTQLLNTLTIMSFFGAAGLVLLAAMLSLLRIASGLRIWLPAMLSAALALTIGTIVLNPESLKSSTKQTAVYVPFHLAPTVPQEPAAPQNSAAPQETVAPQTPATPPASPATSSLLSLRERAGVRGTQEMPSILVRPATASEFRHVRKPGDRDDSAQTVYWNPRLIAGSDGRAKIEFDLSGTKTTFRLRINAQAAGGRLAAAEYDLQSGP
jgi:hypothetical protein